MKISICTLAIGENYKEGVKICLQSLTEYSQKHNYTLIQDDYIHDTTREPMWSKILLIQKTLKQDYDYIFWIDADILIMNDSKKLEDLILLYMCRKDMMLCIDSGDQINTGFWVIRNTDFSKRILELIYRFDQYAGLYHEQGVLNTLYKKNIEKCQDKILILGEVEQRLFNSSLSTYREGDFLIHLLGIRNPIVIKDLSTKLYPRKYSHETDDQYSARMALKKTYTDFPNSRYSIPKPKIQIGVCCIGAGEKYAENIIHWSQKNFRKYCERYRYEYTFISNLLDTTIEPHWSKILLMRQLLDKYDYLVLFDADIIIMNHDISIEHMITTFMSDKQFLMCKDISGHINTGVWIVRNSEYSKRILELNSELRELQYRGYFDQDVFNRLYNENIHDLHNNSVILQNDRLMNCCIGRYRFGVFLVHFFSVGKETIQKAFNDFYPFVKDGETQVGFDDRMRWIKTHYPPLEENIYKM